MDSALNPYSPGSGRRPPELVGRAGELEAFGTLVARTSNGLSDRGIVLTGLRGVGKTVLLNEMHAHAERNEWLTVRLEARRDDAGAAAVRHTLARELVIAARKLTRRSPTARMRRALETITAFNATIGATGISLGVDRKSGRADSGDPEVDLLELVEDVAIALGEKRRAFGLFIDEMQDLDDATIGALLAAQHLAGQREWPFYVLGAGLPNLPRKLTEVRSYAERLFSYRQIGRLPPSEAGRALVEPAMHPTRSRCSSKPPAGTRTSCRSTGRRSGTSHRTRPSLPATPRRPCSPASSTSTPVSSGHGGSAPHQPNGASCSPWPPTTTLRPSPPTLPGA